MFEWWQGLSEINQWLYAMALFFSLLFLWQMISAVSGLSVDHDIGVSHDGFDAAGLQHPGDADLEASGHHPGAAAEIQDSLMAFKLFSVRSVMAFFTLFSWASALYMDNGAGWATAILLGLAWGAGGLVGVAIVFHFMRKMAETGTRRLSSCVGSVATVYLHIPPGGQGEIRVVVSGVISVIKARCPAARQGVASGTPVKVVRVLATNMVEVAPETAPVDAG